MLRRQIYGGIGLAVMGIAIVTILALSTVGILGLTVDRGADFFISCVAIIRLRTGNAVCMAIHHRDLRYTSDSHDSGVESGVRLLSFRGAILAVVLTRSCSIFLCSPTDKRRSSGSVTTAVICGRHRSQPTTAPRTHSLPSSA